MPTIGRHDDFESRYTTKLKAELAPLGQFVEYERDRAALDLGLHLYEDGPLDHADRALSQVRVWFQLKGKLASTLPAAEAEKADALPVADLRVEDVRYWYAHPEPVYLALYLEAQDRFLASDVRDLVDAEGGMPWLRSRDKQQTVTLKMPTHASLEDAIARMPRHRTIRADGPDFRGRPLGHRFDPLRSELAKMEPDDFDALVTRLLDAHEFHSTGEVDLAALLDREIGRVTAHVGLLYLTYEWVPPITTEFGYDDGSDFRIEGRSLSAHGDVLVVVQSVVGAAPRPTQEVNDLVTKLKEEGVEDALVFFNSSDIASGLFGGWRVTLDPLVSAPLGLGAIAFNVLTATSVYLDFLDRLSWRHVNYR